MSANITQNFESFDLDLLKFEIGTVFTKEDESNLDEFVGQLQDAFSFANKTNLEEQLIFIAIEKTFKEYFDCVDIEIKQNYNDRLKLLRIGA